jgi:hypothetical protein
MHWLFLLPTAYCLLPAIIADKEEASPSTPVHAFF